MPENPPSSPRELVLPMGHDAITRILPHRYPFLMVDKVLEVERDKRALAIKNVTANEPFFAGHFPGLPLMPGVLMLEALAQVGAILVYYSTELDPDHSIAFLAAVDGARFRRPVRPGDTLFLEVTKIAFRRGICKVHGCVVVDDFCVCEADLTAAVRKRDEALP